MNKLFSILLIISASLYASDEKPAAPKKENSKRLKLNFEEDLVLGEAQTPDVNFIKTKDEYNYKKIIKIRENFIPEVESSGTIFKGK